VLPAGVRRGRCEPGPIAPAWNRRSKVGRFSRPGAG
jgi:hypothetical protein